MAESKEKSIEFERKVKTALAGREPKLYRILTQCGCLYPSKVTAAQLSRLWGVSEAAINKWWKEMGCPRNAKTKLFDLVDVIAWREDQLKADDVETAGGESPGLERYRIAKAALAELELDQRKRVLLPRDEVHAALSRMAAILRGTGESLQRVYGAEAQKILDEALDEFAREVESAIPEVIKDPPQIKEQDKP